MITVNCLPPPTATNDAKPPAVDVNRQYVTLPADELDALVRVARAVGDVLGPRHVTGSADMVWTAANAPERLGEIARAWLELRRVRENGP